MAAPSLTVPPPNDLQADVYAWTGVVARSRLPMNTKLIAFTVTTFANGNGSRVFPGISRLIVRTGLSRSTITRGLARLREVGLLELVRRGNRRRRLADEYRLILAPDLLERIDLPSLEDEADEADKLSREHAEGTRRRQRKQTFTVDWLTVNNAAGAVDNPPETPEKSITFTVTTPTAETRSYGQKGPSFTVTALTPHLRIEHLPRKTTHGSSLAGNHQSPSTTAANGRQLPLVAVLPAIPPEPIPIDPNQLGLLETEPPPEPPGRAERAADWNRLENQLTRINTHATKEPA